MNDYIRAAAILGGSLIVAAALYGRGVTIATGTSVPSVIESLEESNRRWKQDAAGVIQQQGQQLTELRAEVERLKNGDGKVAEEEP